MQRSPASHAHTPSSPHTPCELHSSGQTRSAASTLRNTSALRSACDDVTLASADDDVTLTARTAATRQLNCASGSLSSAHSKLSVSCGNKQVRERFNNKP